MCSVLKFLFIAYPWLAFPAERYLADVCRVFTGKYMNQKWCFARGNAENLNGARTAQLAVTNRTNGGVSGRVSE